MIDVLTITKSKQYISIESLPSINFIPSDALPFLHDPDANKRSPAPHILSAKKCALSGAANILISAHERLSASLTPTEASSNGMQQSQAPQSARARTSQWQLAELQHMRRHWRIRLVDDRVIGDLSYTASGGFGPKAGLFEVRRVQSNTPADCIELVMPRDLQGEAELELCLFEESNVDTVMQHMFSDPLRVNPSVQHPLPDCRAELKELSQVTSVRLNQRLVNHGFILDPRLPPWHLALQRAQQNLFLRELFAQLTREAPLLSSSYNLIVRENQLMCSLFDDFFLRITFHHSFIYPERLRQSSSSVAATGSESVRQSHACPLGGARSVVRSHAASLLHCLALQALRDVHHSRLHLLGHTLGLVCSGNPSACGAGPCEPRQTQLGVLGARYAGVPSEPLRLGFYAPPLPRVPPTAVSLASTSLPPTGAAGAPAASGAPTAELAQNALLLGYLLHAATFIAAHDMCALCIIA